MHQGRGLGQTHVDVVKEVRPQKHTVYMYVCLQQREIFVRHTVLTSTEVRVSCWTAHVGERGAVAEVSEATCRIYNDIEHVSECVVDHYTLIHKTWVNACEYDLGRQICKVCYYIP